MKIISIQSHVVYGHVGNAAAVFPMQRLGVEVWPIHTVQFSNHTGYGSWGGRVFDGTMIDELMDGVASRGALEACDGVLSGYMGSVEIGTSILSAVSRVNAANRSAVYACDPVIGDRARGVFVRPGIAEFMRDLAVPRADIITPNQFELDYLSGIETRNIADLRRALAIVHGLGPKVVLVTSFAGATTPDDAIDLIASAENEIWLVRTPKLAIEANGAGDAIAALFLVHYLKDRSARTALGESASSIFGVLRRTAEAGVQEMLIVDAQEEFVCPSRRFEPVKL